MLNKIFITSSKETPAHILGRRLLKKGVKEALGKDDFELSFNENGKPYLKDYPHFHFNISHSGNTVAVAFGSSEIGVDIEKLRPVNIRVAERFFTPNEKTQITTPTDFFAVWTRKEAVIKKDGKALKDLSTIDTTARDDIKTFIEGEFVISICSKNADQYILEKNPKI